MHFLLVLLSLLVDPPQQAERNLLTETRSAILRDVLGSISLFDSNLESVTKIAKRPPQLAARCQSLTEKLTAQRADRLRDAWNLASELSESVILCLQTTLLLALKTTSNPVAGDVAKEPDLESLIRQAVEKGIRPDQVGAWIPVTPEADTGAEHGLIALQGIRFTSDGPTIIAMRDATRYLFWVRVKGDTRPIVGIYWDKQNKPHAFMGWLKKPI